MVFGWTRGFGPAQLGMVLLLYTGVPTVQIRVSMTVVHGLCLPTLRTWPSSQGPSVGMASALLSLSIFISLISASLLGRPVNTCPGSSMELV